MRKHLLFEIIVLLNTMYVMSQDVIFRSSSDSIHVQVLTIGTTDITYKKWNNLDGPAYSIPVNEVVAIRYENGTYDFFSNKSAVVTPDKSNKSSSPLLTRSGNTYYYENRVMNKQATLEWLKTQNCPTAYEQFRSGLKTANAGWALMATGLGADLVGTIILKTRGAAFGYILTVIGSALEIACIPTIAVGYSKMHQTANVYNISCGSTAQIKQYWSIQASNNGLGIAYNF